MKKFFHLLLSPIKNCRKERKVGYFALTNHAFESIIIYMERIYLDNAATTPLDRDVLEKMLPYLTEIYGNADSPHANGRKAMSAVDDARDTVAKLLGVSNKEIYFTSGGTESDNWAMLGVARALKAQGKNKIILSAIEHHACLSSAERLQKEGFEVVYLPVNEGGRVEINALKEVVDTNTALVCVMACNNETGVLQPIDECADIAHSVGAYFFTDAVQLAPHRKISVKEIKADLLSISSHKFYGPKGVGVLYIKNGVKIQPIVGGGEQERGLRGGTLNVAGIVGLAEAYKRAVESAEDTEKRLQKLNELFLKELQTLDGVTVNGDRENALPSILNLRFAGVENTSLLYNLDLQGVSLSAGSACASASVKPSHVLLAMSLTEKEVRESVRISFGKHTTEEEVERTAKLIKETVERLRR
jgi:cysteine desulfurase